MLFKFSVPLFATPDGQSGQMGMFLWDNTNVRPPLPFFPPNVS